METNRNHAEIAFVFLSDGYTAEYLLNDFKEWSGGYTLDEVETKTIEEYIDSSIPLPLLKVIHIAFNDFSVYDHTLQHLMRLTSTYR